MTQIEQIKAEIKKRISDIEMSATFSQQMEGGKLALKSILDFIDSLPKNTTDGIVKEAHISPAMLSNFGNSLYNFEVELTLEERNILGLISFNTPTAKIRIL